MPITLVMEQVAFAVQPGKDGNRNLLFQDRQSGIVVHVPLGEDNAKGLAVQLTSDVDIAIATEMPKPNRAARRSSAKKK